MVRENRTLSKADKEQAFCIATRALSKLYGDQIAQGMTNEALSLALKQVLGIFGGSCGPGRLDVMHQASGLRIWAGWHIVNHCTEPPLFQGRQTLAMARYVYGISDPDDAQMSLL